MILRFFSHLFATAFTLLLITLVIVLFFVGTESGLNSGLRFIKPLLPGTLQWQSTRGTVLSGMVLRKLRYVDVKKNSPNQIHIDHLRLRLDLHELLWGHLTLGQLTAKGVRVNWPKLDPSPASTTPSTTANPASTQADTSLPLTLKIHHAQLDDATILIGDRGVALKHLRLQGALAMQPALSWQLTVSSEDVNLKSSTGWDSHLNASFDSQGVASVSNPRLQLTLKNLSGRWHQQPVSGSGAIDWRGANMQVSPFHIQVGQTMLRLSGRMDQQRLHLTWGLQAPQLSQLLTDASGSLHAQGQLTGDKQHPVIQATVSTPYLAYQDTRLQAVHGKLYWAWSGSPKNQANLTAERLMLAGNLLSKLALSVKTKADKSIDLNAKAFVPALNLNIAPLKLHIIPKADQYHLDGHIQTGAGALKLQGTLYQPTDTRFSQLHIRGNRVMVANAPQYEVYVSPDLTARWNASELHLTGDLTIPEARIVPQYTAGTVTLPEDTVITQGRHDAIAAKASYALYTHLRLQLGKAVQLRYQTLSGRLQGTLLITDAPHQPTLAQGELALVDGQLAVVGQKLQVKRGRVIFTGGPVTQPNLDIEAVRTLKTAHRVQSTSIFTSNNDAGSTQPPATEEVSSFTVGVRATGPAQKPNIRFFSSPITLSRENILSYLVLGRSLEQASKGDATLLLQAASLLNMNKSGAGDLTSKFKKILHVDTLKFETDASSPTGEKKSALQGTALTLGKYLSPKFYLSYRYQVADQVNALTLRYQLSKKWTVQGYTSNDSSGVDLLYTIDK